MAGIFYMLEKLSADNDMVITITCSCPAEELPEFIANTHDLTMRNGARLMPAPLFCPARLFLLQSHRSFCAAAAAPFGRKLL